MKSEDFAIVRFVYPVGAGSGDGTGAVIGRKGDTLLVDTGLDIIEVPVKLVFDGTIPPSPPKVTSASRMIEWLIDNRPFIVAGILAVLGMLVGYFVIPPLLLALLSQGSDQPNDLSVDFQIIVQILNIMACVSMLIGSYKLFDTLTQQEPLSESSAVLHCGVGIFVYLLARVLELDLLVNF